MNLSLSHCPRWRMARLAAAGLLLGGNLFFGQASAQTSSLLRLDSLQVQSAQPLVLIFSDLGTGATNYQLQFAETADAMGGWLAVDSAMVTDLGGGQYQITAPAPVTDQGYYRVRAQGGTSTVTASFSASSLQVTEGGTIAPVITFSAPFSGLVRYSISGTVASGDYVNLSGQIMVNGTSATIPVTFLDNDLIGQLKYLTLTLEAGEGYEIGAARTTITVDENDAQWRGTFQTRGAHLGFVLAVRDVNGTAMASLSSDQLGFFPSNQTSVAIAFLSDQFQLDAAGLPLDATAASFQTPVQLQLHLSAMNGVGGQSVSPTAVEGEGYLVSEFEGKPHLTTTNFGTFVLYKPALAPSTNQVDLVDAN